MENQEIIDRIVFAYKMEEGSDLEHEGFVFKEEEFKNFFQGFLVAHEEMGSITADQYKELTDFVKEAKYKVISV